jgi:hypothetical protein
MIYRMRIYTGVSANVAAFNDLFATLLLPNQLKHGARLVGRWQTEGDKIVAVWEYASREDYDRIEEAVRRDALAKKAQRRLARLPKLYETMEETFMVSTLEPLSDR